MKRMILTAVLILTVLCAGHAQYRPAGMPGNNEIGALVGMNVPFYQGTSPEIYYGVTYAHYTNLGVGFRAGLNYAPSFSGVKNSFGIPVAIGFSSAERSNSERLRSATYGAMDAVDGLIYGGIGGAAAGLASGFFRSLFSQTEYFLGVTPGFVTGGDSARKVIDDERTYTETWTEKKNAFQCSVDFGACLNCAIWRFDLKIQPAFHYMLTNNYTFNNYELVKKSGTETNIIKPVKWYFSLSGGISFKF